MIWRLIATSSVLVGCTTTVSSVPTVEVPVPVIQACVDARAIPAAPRTHMRPGSNVEALSAGASADVRELQLHAMKLDAMLRACAETEGGKP